MVAETQQRINGKSTANGFASPTNSYDLKTANQQKQEDYKRLAENTMQVCNVNVNLMENSLASR